MAKNGKGFEKFLREYSSNVNSQIAYRSDLSPRKPVVRDKEKDKTQFFKNAPELGTPEGDAYSAGEKLLTAIKEKKPQDEIEAAAKTAREANVAVSDTKRISPSYWVTQKDFQDAFGRRYDAMSEQDRQDFFGLVGSSKPRRYTEGPAAGQVIPSTRRPDFIPTYQDVDGVKVPETAFGGAPSKEKSQGFGFQAPTAPSQVSGSGVLGGPKVKPDLSDEEYERRRQERISQKARELLSREPAPAPEPPPAPEPKSLSDLELERMKRDAEEAPAPAPDPVVATLVSEPISLEDLYKAWDPDGKIRAEQEAEFKQKEARENAAELTTGELQKALGYYGKSTSTTPKEPKKGEYLPWFMRMQNQPLPASPPVEGLPFDRNKPFETSANFSQRPPEGWEKQSVTARPPGVSAEFSSKDLSGTGLYGGVLGQMRFARGQRPSQQEVGVMGPSRSEAELSRMMRDAREAPSAVGPSMYPGIPSSVASLIAAYSPAPAPAPDPAPAPEAPEAPAPDAVAGVDVEGPPRSEAERSKMMRDAQEELPKGFRSWPEYNDVILQQMATDEISGSSEGLGAGVRSPSGLEQAMRLAQGAGEFGRNLDQAAGRKVREAGQKISDIAKRFRTQRDENARKNIERLEAQGIRVPGFDTRERGFGQRNVQYAEAGLDTEGPPSPASYGGGFEPEPAPAPEPEPAPAVEPESTDLGYLGPVQIYDKESERAKSIRRMIGMDPLGQLQYERRPRVLSSTGKEQIAPSVMSAAPRRGIELEDGMQMPKDVADAIRQRDESRRKQSRRSAPVEGGMNVPLDIADFETPAVPQTVAAQISKEEKPKDETSSPISPEMASQMLQVQTPGQAPIQKPAKQTNVTPQSVAEYMKTVPAARQVTATPEMMRQRITPKQGVMSFTAGMSEAEVDQEFERIFGKPTSQRLSGLSLNAKRDMIGRYRLKQAGEE